MINVDLKNNYSNRNYEENEVFINISNIGNGVLFFSELISKKEIFYFDSFKYGIF
jgi:hypothetical protein